MSRLPLHRAAILTALALGPLAACKLSTDPLPDATLCVLNTTPANSGCARLRGVVLDGAGRPLEAVHLALRVDTARDVGPYSFREVVTGTDGQFGLELVRLRALTGQPSPDTLTARLIFAVPDSTRLGNFFLDSIPMLLHFAAPGQTAFVDTVTVRPPTH